MKRVDVLTLGELLIDMFPQEIGFGIGEVEAFIPKPGGAPANVAVAASRLGVRSAFIGKVGDDHFGTYLKDVLDREGVITRGLRMDTEARTTMAVIAMPDESSAQFVFYRNPGADQRLTPEELDEELIQSATALHVGSVSLTDEPARSATFRAVRLTRQTGGMVSYDVNYRPSLWQDQSKALVQAQRMLSEVDLVKVNESEAAMLLGLDQLDPGDISQLEGAAKALLDQGPTLVVITLGSEGSYFQIEAGGGFVPPYRVKTVDAIGCGDAFVAGMLCRLVEAGTWKTKLSVDELMGIFKFANAVGALTSLNRGVIPALPTLIEVNRFLDDRN